MISGSSLCAHGTKTSLLQQRSVKVQANYEPGNKRRSPPKQSGAGNARQLPQSGYFSQADPKAPVVAYRPRGSGDPLEKGGRYSEEFIWNTKWQDALKYDEDVKRQIEEAKTKKSSEQQPSGKGYISFGTLSSLDDISVDLSKQLRPRTPERDSPSPSPSPSPSRSPAVDRRVPGVYARVPPTKAEARRWNRSRAVAGRAPAAAVSPEPQEMTEEAKEKLEKGRERYEELKKQTQFWTIGITAVVFACTESFYSRDVSLSYLFGAVGGFFYLRSLSRSVDAVGAEGGAAGAANPRLLIPLILVLAANRWNELQADEYGVHLQILPELLGFFTYKAAVVGINFTALLREYVDGDFKSENEEGKADDEKDDGDGDSDAMSVDRAFVKRITWG